MNHDGPPQPAPTARPQVPGATRALAVLRLLAAAPGPVPAAVIARDLGVPRSTVYHLLTAMVDEGFVTHLPEERRYGLGVAAFEIGSAYSRQEPLQRLARPLMARLVDDVRQTAHLAVLHGREVLYVVEERAPGRASLVTDVGVRLPAQLAASGRAMLAALPAAQVRALFPDVTAFVLRHDVGPATPSALRQVLTQVRRDGFARENGEITPGFASVAAVVRGHTGHPAAAVAITFEPARATPGEPERLTTAVLRTASALERRVNPRS
jgi:DNA-binding IclR family transcriptional regulator